VKKKQNDTTSEGTEVAGVNDDTRETGQDIESIDEGDEINRLLDEGYSVKQIIDLGFKRRTTYHHARMRMQPENDPSGSVQNNGQGGKGRQELIKLSSKDVIPPEAVLDVLHLPQNGDAVEVWRRGVLDGVGFLLLGARYAQLTAAGQADIVKNQLDIMREAKESNKDIALEAARQVGDQLGQATLQSNQEILAALRDVAAAQGKSPEPDPWKAMTVRLTEPMLGQAMQMLSTTLFKAFPQPGLGQQAVPVQQPPAQAGPSGQAQAGPGDVFGSLPENITIHNLNELEEE
jgi:hypothetical protein